MRDFVSMGLPEHTEKPRQQGCFHVLSNITDTSYLIGDGTGRGLQQRKYFVF